MKTSNTSLLSIAFLLCWIGQLSAQVTMTQSSFPRAAGFTDSLIITANTLDYYPEPLRNEIDEINAMVYPAINNGVYRAGFATSQQAYEKAYAELFAALDSLEERLSSRRYLLGDVITEADWRLFTTLVRFDMVYHLHFKCNRRRIIDYPNLWAYTRELYQWEGVAETVNFEHIVRHYHYSHETINPNRIIPINPVLDWHEPHGRG